MSGVVGDTVRFNILGSLECWHGPRRVRFGGQLQERVLTLLLLHAGHVVTVSRLIEAVWENTPPPTAMRQVRKTVAELRRRIPGGAELIATETAGYRIVVGGGQLDLNDFRWKVQEATTEVAEGRPHQAISRLGVATALWRGPVLSGRGGPVIDVAATALEEQYLAALEQLCELRLAVGESAGLVSDLRRAVHAHPLRERLRGQLMLALYRSGQQAAALAEYGTVRDLLAAELGIDPSAELSRLHEDILRGGSEPPASSRSDSVRPAADPSVVPSGAEIRPCMLPYDLADFAGREPESRRLVRMGSDGRTGVVGIDGMGGAGKSTLAVHVAHQLAVFFPAGQLYVDLRGFTPGEKPLQPDFVAAMLLRELGATDTQIPDDAQGRLALWRSWTANRRLLLILDNAVDTAQVRPLLDGMTSGFVIVTGRGRLVDLDGIHWLSIGSMEPEQSLGILTRTLGEKRVAAEPEAARELAELCGHLPLALRIATARLRNRPQWTLRYLVGRLNDESRLLKELSSAERSVATTIQLSYQVLPPAQQRAFRLLGLHPGTDIDAHAAAALLGMTTQDAEDSMEALLDVHLLRQPAIGLYAFHDLVRSFARELWRTTSGDERSLALAGLLDFYVAATDQACRLLFPGRTEYDVTGADPCPNLPPTATPAEARLWFDRELRALPAFVTVGLEAGFARLAAYLARNLLFPLHERGDIRRYREVAEVGLSAARRAGDPVAMRFSLRNLVVGHSMLGEFHAAADGIEEGLRLSVAERNPKSEGVYLSQLGWVHSALGRLAQGREFLERAVAVCRATSNDMEESIALCNLSSVCRWLGDDVAAMNAAQRAVALNRRTPMGMHQAGALNDLAMAHISSGDHNAALASLGRVLGLDEDSLMPRDLALTYVLMADVCQCAGRDEQALHFVGRALALVEPLGTKPWQSEIENIAGLIHSRRGDHARALRLHRRAFLHATSVSYRVQVAMALAGSARASEGMGDLAAAEGFRNRASEHFAAMGMPAPRELSRCGGNHR
ncbi:AfsR/SARP family transcriptional regulator [Actinoplanes campanulatus]|uniref:AfsR/SARP family transcriptional regulator n=1 Tax=Actinoplanes campanulatus TaxID=113559 RepID=UPI001952E927|nr:BTAD domain-containing putative transcriptional regulator [Actinoplanes capillaceus]